MNTGSVNINYQMSKQIFLLQHQTKKHVRQVSKQMLANNYTHIKMLKCVVGYF